MGEGDPVRDRRHFLVNAGMRDELKRRQDIIRSLFAGRPLDSVPIYVKVTAPAETTVQERYLDAEKQLDAALASALATWELAPSSDAIPALFPDVGCSCLASAFGSQYYWGDDLEQTPGVASPIITDLEQQVELLPDPDPYRDGWLPEGLRRIRMFADAGQGFFPVTLLDAAGGLNVAADLMSMTELLLAFYTAPDAVRRLLDKIQRLFLSTIRAGIEAAGGEQNIANTDFFQAWFPEGAKGHVSDDVSSAFGPNMYLQFSAPYHALVFDEFGRGGMHNCGPHPSHAAYFDNPLSPRAIDVMDGYSHNDLANLRRSLRKKAFIYLDWGGDCDPVPWYRGIMEQMAPDVVVIPVIKLAPTDHPEELCQALRPIADEYAKRMDWGWET